MNTSTAFFCAMVFFLMLFCSLLIMYPFVRKIKFNSKSANIHIETSVHLFKQRIQEIETDLHLKNIDAISYKQQKLELEQQLLNVSKNHNNTYTNSDNNKKPNFWLISVLLFSIPLVTSAAYLLLSDRYSKIAVQWQHLHQYDEPTQKALNQQKYHIDTKDFTDFLSVMQYKVHQHNSTNAWYQIARLYDKNKDFTQAQFAYNTAHHLEPDNINIVMEMVQLDFRVHNGKLDEANKQRLQKIIERKPKHEGARLLLILHSMNMQDYITADRYINQLKVILGSKKDRTHALSQLDSLQQTLKIKRLAQESINPKNITQ